MAEPAAGPSDVAIDYAPGAPVRRRRRRRRRVIAALVFVAACLAVWRGPELWNRAWTAYVTREACNFDAAEGSAVYADAPGTSRLLMSSGATTAPGGVTPAATMAPDPPVVARLARIAADPRIFSMFAHMPGAPGPLAFLHERTTPEGRRVLVAVRIRGLTYYPADGGVLAVSYHGLELNPNGSRPPTLVTLSRNWGGVDVDAAMLPANIPKLPTPGAIKVYFGTPDPSDASKFTIPYEVNGKKRAWKFRVREVGIELEDQVRVRGE